MGRIPHYENGRWSKGDDRLTRALAAIPGDYADLDSLGFETVAALECHAADSAVILYGPAPGRARQLADIPPYVIEITGGPGPARPGLLTAGTLPDALDVFGRWASPDAAGMGKVA